jgi:hypothetical protein
MRARHTILVHLGRFKPSSPAAPFSLPPPPFYLCAMSSLSIPFFLLLDRIYTVLQRAQVMPILVYSAGPQSIWLRTLISS